MNYHILYGIVFLGAVLSFVPQLAKYRRVMLWYVAALLAVFAGLRVGVGFDYNMYNYMFGRMPTLQQIISEGYSNPFSNIETGYFILNVIVRSMGFNLNVVLFIMAVSTLFVLVKAFKVYSPYPALVLMLYVARFYFVRDMGQIRASLAAGIGLYAIQFLKDNKFGRFFSLVFAAFLFHRSSILLLVLMVCHLIFKKGIPTKLIIGLLALAFLIGSLDLHPIIMMLEPIIPDHYMLYLSADWLVFPLGLTNPVLLMQILIIIGALIFRKQMKNPYFEVLFSGYIISTLILAGLNYFGTAAGRASTYFATFEVLLIPMFIDVFEKKSFKELLEGIKDKAKWGNFIPRHLIDGRFSYLRPYMLLIVFVMFYGFVIYNLIFVHDAMPHFGGPYRSIFNP